MADIMNLLWKCASVKNFFNRSDLLAVGESLEKGELSLDELDELLPFCALELYE